MRLMTNVDPFKNYNCFIDDKSHQGAIFIVFIEFIPFLIIITMEIFQIIYYIKNSSKKKKLKNSLIEQF
jgi:hypothetical protein